MLWLYHGLYHQLSPAHRDAVHQLTLRRYLRDVLHLCEFIEDRMHLQPGTPAFMQAHRARVESVSRYIGDYDRASRVTAIFLEGQTHAPAAIAAMRTVIGTRADLTLDQAAGRPDSSLPTHVQLDHVRYPILDGFDPAQLSERALIECGRAVTVDAEQGFDMVQAGWIDPATLDAVSGRALDELFCATAIGTDRIPGMHGWIFSTRPMVASLLRLRKGLNLIPLYTDGVEPTAHALDTEFVYASVFAGWERMLHRLAPETTGQHGTRAVIRSLAGRDIRAWGDIPIYLPFLLRNNPETTAAIARLQDGIDRQTGYMIERCIHTDLSLQLTTHRPISRQPKRSLHHA